MKKLFIFLFCVFVQFLCSAQKVYFLYFQSEAGSPFYIKMGDKLYSSSASGYLILPKLVDSTYSISIGQPAQTTSTEPQFFIPLNKKDRGFLVKNLQSGLSLFDLQSLALIMPASAKDNVVSAGSVKNDQFTTLLAGAANDSSLLVKKNVVENSKEIVKTKALEKSSATDTITQQTIINSTETPMPKEKDASSEVTNKLPEPDTSTNTVSDPITDEYKRSVVMKRSESSTTEGFGLVYIDNTDGQVDTVRLVIPNSKIALVSTNTENNTVADKRFLEVDEKENKPAAAKANEKQKVDCKATAGDKDFFKVRRDMAAQTSIDKMIAEAVRYFKRKCFTTSQIRMLSSLFLTPEGKYNFFAEAYPYVLDSTEFATLESELRDREYENRFKTILKK